jgi:hypothetical protein
MSAHRDVNEVERHRQLHLFALRFSCWSKLLRNSLFRKYAGTSPSGHSLAHGRDFAAQPSIKAEATAAAVDDKQENQHREEQVRPRPLGRTTVEAEPAFASALAPSVSRATI